MAEDGSMTSEPLATYTERLLEVRREFALHEDRVLVRARWLPKRRFERVVELAGLEGDVQEIVVRYRMYRYAGWILAIGALAFAACSYGAGGGPLGVGGYLALAVTVAGALLVAITYPNRRIHFARFSSRGGRIGLDVGSAGNDTATFQQFVEAVRRQIRKAGKKT